MECYICSLDIAEVRSHKPSGQWVLRELYKPNPSFNHVTDCDSHLGVSMETS